MPSHEEKLVGYVLAEMMNGDQVKALCSERGIRVPRGGRHEQCRALGSQFKFEDVHQFCLGEWARPSEQIHLNNLKSGLLTGFSWHDLAPSRLHLGLQGHVRRVARGEITLQDFLSIGADVIHKEYVMVAIADLTEIALVDRCGATPPARAKSVSDVVLRGYPFDVKNGAVPRNWSVEMMRSNPQKFARDMIEGADPERMRKQATTAFSEWALNRIFVNVADENRWLQEPEALLDELADVVSELKDPMELEFGENRVLVHVVVV